MARLSHTYGPAIVFALEDLDARHVRLIYDVNLQGVPRRRQSTELSVACAMHVVQLFAGHHSEPEAVYFRHDTDLAPAVYRRYFGVAPRFRQDVNAIELKRSFIDTALDGGDERLRSSIDEYLAPLIDRSPLTIAKQVEQLAARLLPAHRCRLNVIAEQLSMNERTLQRHLDGAGVVFERMCEELRKQRALEYLADPRIPIAQVAGLIGYSEQSAFTRACRRWFQITPKTVRAALLNGEPIGPSPVPIGQTAKAAAGNPPHQHNAGESRDSPALRSTAY
jgi:AraC-like DNA-binding protein